MVVSGEQPAERGDRSGGREAQRRRTRAGIVAATADLLRTGATPSVGQIAEAADVSRRTVYEYFPTLEHLLLDATLGLLDQTAVDAAIRAATPDPAATGRVDPVADAEARVSAVIRAIGDRSAEQLPFGRQLVRLTVESPPPAENGTPRRGFRRIGWIEEALAPLRGRLDAPAFERLVSALAMVIGWEAFIVLSDVRGLDQAQQLDIVEWSARALIRAAL